MKDKEIALIVGVGEGLSASLARLCAANDMTVAIAARTGEKCARLAAEIGGLAYPCNAADTGAVKHLFAAVTEDLGTPHLVAYNPSYRTRGPIAELDPQEVEKTLRVTAFGGFLVGQAAARAMLKAGRGSILFTGASASVKGYARSAPFAMGKFALRGLAQSMARELAPSNIHVAHFIIDGGIDKPGRAAGDERGPDGRLQPDAIARAYLDIHRQHRSAWTSEVALRPWTETF
jgi:NAD(P)-dependent dehydrogenase (short-subunit alcohol dehydrogenase family)